MCLHNMQRCPSGLRCSPGKAVCEKLHQEFESLPLRQKEKYVKSVLITENNLDLAINIQKERRHGYGTTIFGTANS